MHQSIPAGPMLTPTPPPGNRGAFAHVVSPGGGAFANFIAARGLGISVPQGDPRAFDMRVFERWKYVAFVKTIETSRQRKSNRCINLRGKPYIVFTFLRERKQGVFAQQKAENCSRNDVCRNDGTS